MRGCDRKIDRYIEVSLYQAELAGKGNEEAQDDTNAEMHYDGKLYKCSLRNSTFSVRIRQSSMSTARYQSNISSERMRRILAFERRPIPCAAHLFVEECVLRALKFRLESSILCCIQGPFKHDQHVLFLN
jgi:hypothetical protein